MRRSAARRIGSVVTAGLLGVGLLIGLPGPASAIDSGDLALNQAPDFAHGCEVAPMVIDAQGNFGLTGNPTGSCTWFQSGQALTAGGRLTGYVPANGTVTSLRVRSGPNPAPVRVTVLRQITQIRPDGTLHTGSSACCVGQRMTAPIRLRPNAITEIPLNLPVRNGRDNVNRIAVSDIIGISAVAGTGRLPLRITGPATVAAASVPGTPIAGYFAPQIAPNQIRTNMTAANNLRLTLNFSFCASGPASVRHAARQGARVTRCGSRITSNRIRSTPNRKAVRVPVACTNGVACRGKVRITTRGKKKRSLGTSRYVVKAGQTKQVKVKLTKRGRQALKQRKRTKARTVVTVRGAANSQRPVVMVRRK